MDVGKEFFNCMKENNHMSTVWLFPAQEVTDDPYENTKTVTFRNPVPVQAIVKDITPSSLRWKFQGILPQGSKQVICEKNIKYFLK